MPPHRGHQYLCDVALQLCDQLTILVCSIDSEPIPGGSRAQWMRELYPQARVLHCAEDLPQLPEDHPDFWQLWIDAIGRYHPESVQRVFASEPYGAEIARRLGANFIPVDLERIACPVSGTQIRSAPWSKWDAIVPPARPWFTRVVSLHGPESTGKTTLATQLAAEFSTILVPEYGRTYTQCFGQGCTADDVLQIAQGQTAAIAAARNQARGLVVTDTDAIMSAVWSEMLTGRRDDWFESSAPTADLYLLTDIDIPWTDDGTRYFADPAQRRRFSALCEAELIRRGLSYIKISGNAQERFERACAAIRDAFSKLL